MKRAFTIMLMTVVLLLSLLVPAGAEQIWCDYPRNTVPLWNADENWGSYYTVDTQNQTEGEGCISINLNGVTGTLAPFKKLDPVDATGMLALEFDMYISDLAILDHLQTITSGSIEICSGGSCDQGELNFSLSALAKKLQKGCPRIGWNHVVLRFMDMKETHGSYGVFDSSHVDYLRIYWTGMTDCGQDWTMKFDNFVLTDREVEPSPHTPGQWEHDEDRHWRFCSHCEMKIDEAMHRSHAHPPFTFDEAFTCYACGLECAPLAERGKYAELIQGIEELSKACEDPSAQTFDHHAARAQYDALHAKWNALAYDEQEVLTAHGYYKKLGLAKLVIEECEDIEYILKKNETLISDLIWLYENRLEFGSDVSVQSRAKDLVYSSRNVFDSETKIVKRVLEDHGYLAMLEAAEDALSPHSHDFTDQSTKWPARSATCSAGPTYYYRCSICGAKGEETFEQGEPVPGAHDFGEWEELRPATKEQSGLQKRSCLGCSYEETQELAYVRTDDDGCSAVLVSGVPAMLAFIAAAGWMLRKKKK
ncbi:MAG: hypothetical protein E7594_09725 [Ruminococcaceae bacterium]|nr:hypothetical protein [Oscillospiraceae bacterium]MBE6677096.1 hypothetical protein [Oscillospiraceae bacterium]